MKLYTSPGACSLAGHIVLHWIGRPFALQVVSRQEKKSPEFLALNPAGAVPVLEHDGWVLTQNVAILNYLIDLHPEAGLGGEGTPRSRAEVNRWLAFLNADVHPAFHPLFGSTAYLGDDAAVDRTRDAAKQTLRKYFERADARLAGRDYLTGTRSVADAYLFVILRWAKAMQVDLSGLDNIERFFERMKADAGVRTAMRAEGLAAG